MGEVQNLGHDVVGVDRLAGPASDPVWDRDVEFREIYLATFARLVRTLWFVVHDHELAQDIAQEAFIDLHRQWRTVGTYDRPDLWVRRVALRKAQRETGRRFRRLRAERSQVARDGFAEQGFAGQGVAGQGVAGQGFAGDGLPDPQLTAALLTLPPMQRAVVALYYLEDRPMEDVAFVLGCQPATGFVHLHRARRRLAELLAEDFSQEVEGEERHVD